MQAITALVAQTVLFALPNPLHVDGDSGSRHNCIVRFQRRPLPGLTSRMVPALWQEDMTVAWQDGESIFLQRYSNICIPQSDVIVVNTSESFWQRPASSGLGDAASLSWSRTAVAWVGGDSHIWVSIIDGASAGLPVRASGPRSWSRTDVKVVADRAHGTFFVAWTSWGQDGDGWGVYLRPFDAKGWPVDDERQVNAVWQDLQWQHQLCVCGSSLWALWLNGTSGSCSSSTRCATGPFLRRLPLAEGKPAAAGEWSTPEVNLTGDGPITAGLFCHGATDAARVMWMEHSGMQFAARTIPPVSLEANTRDNLKAGTADRRRLLSLAAAVLLGDTVDGERASLVMHRAGVGVLLTTNRQDLLEVRLLHYSEQEGDWILYPQRKVQYGARLSRAAWAEDAFGEPTALLLCWSTGSEVQADGPSEFVCMQRRLQWLQEPDGLEISSRLTLLIMIALACSICCFKQCTQNMAPRRRPGRLDRTNGRRRSRTLQTAAEQSRIQELRVQLAAIPAEPPPLPLAADAPEASSENSAVAPRRLESGGSWSDVCGICQEEVVVRVALQRCGHTACRDCARRLMSMNQKCHICREDIESFLPVYF